MGKAVKDFYDDNSSAAFRCKDGDIRFDKDALLLLKPQASKKFEFTGDIFLVDKFSIVEFKSFLDILLGFETMKSYDTASLIFPIAKEYDFSDILEKCIKILKPSLMDKNIANTLNLSVLYHCDELADAVIDYLHSFYNGVLMLFLNEEYCVPLEPKAILFLLRQIPKNEFILNSIIKWGLKYIERNSITDDLCGFLKKTGILGKIPPNLLSSFQSAIDFYSAIDPNEETSLFFEKEWLGYLQNFHSPEVYIWHSNEKSNPLVEHYTLKNPIGITKSMKIFVYFNPFISMKGIKLQGGITYLTCSVQLVVYSGVEMIVRGEAKATFDFKIAPNENWSIECYKEIFAPANFVNQLLHKIKITYNFETDCNILLGKPDLESVFKPFGTSAFTRKICF